MKTLLFFFYLLPFMCAAQSGALKGKVVDKITRAPLDSVSVAAFLHDSVIYSVISDTAGQFQIKPVALGKWRLCAEAHGYARTNLTGIPVSELKTAYVTLEMVWLTPRELRKEKRAAKRKHS